MSTAYRICFCILAVTLGLINPSLTQSQTVPNPTSSEVVTFAAALVGARSEEEQERLLERRKELLDGTLLVALKDSVDSFDKKGDYAQAVRVAQLAVRIAERIGDRLRLANTVRHLGLMYTRQNGAQQALDCYQRSLAIFEEAGDTAGKTRVWSDIAFVYAEQRRWEQALPYYNRALAGSNETGDRKLTALILSNMGNAHSQLGRYELGMELYHKSQVLSEELNDSVTLARTLNNISVHYISQGRYAEGLGYLLKSLKLDEQAGGAIDKRLIALRLQNIGLIYRRQGRVDQALSYSLKSLKIVEELGDSLRIADLQNNIGVIYKSQGLNDDALPWFQKSLEGYEAKQAEGGLARVLNNIGDIYRMQGRHDQALERLEKSLRLRRQNNDRGGVCLTLNNLGLLYRDQGKYAEMLEVSRQSAVVAEEINAREELWTAQELSGTAFVALGNPIDARRSFLAAIATVESLRHEVGGGGQQRQSFLEKRVSPWLRMISLLVSQQEYSDALTFAEQSKARVLLDTLQSGRASLRQSLSQQERQAEEEHRLRLVSLNSQLNAEVRRDKRDPTRVAELKAEITKARLALEDFEMRLYAAHPELKVQRGEASIIKADEVSALLPGTTGALLEYVVTDDKVYLFAITRAGKAEAETRVYTLSVKRDDLAMQIEAFRRQLADRDLGFRASAIKLYQLLLKPVETQLRGKTSIVIAADDTLWDLPFQALLNGANRFVIEDATIAYTPSLTVLREMTQRRKNYVADGGTPTLLALGNPLVGSETINRAALTLRDGKLDPLPEAEQEVKALSRLYGIARSKVYIGAEAREDRVKKEAGQARILHFATHGTLNNASPMYSHLALAAGGNEDGLLEAWELTQLDLKAELAVLSACETARGRIGAGEGMIGLSWAMFIAGVPSTVVSQWKVETAGTRDLMVNFHRAMISSPRVGKATATKAEALRQAALKVMKNPATSHPFYWAGFVLVGDGK